VETGSLAEAIATALKNDVRRRTGNSTSALGQSSAPTVPLIKKNTLKFWIVALPSLALFVTPTAAALA
jgi:hypothetical protein